MAKAALEPVGLGAPLVELPVELPAVVLPPGAVVLPVELPPGAGAVVLENG